MALPLTTIRGPNIPVFIIRDANGGIFDIYQPQSCNAHSFREVYGIARQIARTADFPATVQITCTRDFDAR